VKVANEQINDSAATEEGAPIQREPDNAVALRDKRIAELTDDLKRLQAEFENYKKRVDREGNERVKSANQRLIADLLPILDSFDKALENTKNPGGADGLRKGLEGLHKQFLQTLQREGLKEIRTDGGFDPFLHEAMLREERDDTEDGRILEVYQKGYVLSQKTLRPARVKVARRKLDKKTLEGTEVITHDTPDDEELKDEDQ
jgi:molecular chaperone GrpE